MTISKLWEKLDGVWGVVGVLVCVGIALVVAKRVADVPEGAFTYWAGVVILAALAALVGGGVGRLVCGLLRVAEDSELRAKLMLYFTLGAAGAVLIFYVVRIVTDSGEIFD